MTTVEASRVVNVATVPHRSPFRYPGGKTWLVPVVRQWMASFTRRVNFVEPFAGGAIVGLSVVFEELADNLTLVELDKNVAAVWQVMLNGKAHELAASIRAFEMNEAAVRQLLARAPASQFDRAFATLIRNRAQRGGIMAPGASLMKKGENGRGVASRWYPETLSRRIDDIAGRQHQITFIHDDGIGVMRQITKQTNNVYFIDPPYTVAGRRLYVHSEIDHEELFEVTARLSGEFLMTYDDTEPVRSLARRFRFDTKTVPMKNTHHTVMNELLIGRDLGWLHA